MLVKLDMFDSKDILLYRAPFNQILNPLSEPFFPNPLLITILLQTDISRHSGDAL